MHKGRLDKLFNLRCKCFCFVFLLLFFFAFCKHVRILIDSEPDAFNHLRTIATVKVILNSLIKFS